MWSQKPHWTRFGTKIVISKFIPGSLLAWIWNHVYDVVLLAWTCWGNRFKTQLIFSCFWRLIKVHHSVRLPYCSFLLAYSQTCGHSLNSHPCSERIWKSWLLKSSLKALFCDADRFWWQRLTHCFGRSGFRVQEHHCLLQMAMGWWSWAF
jgi:hypothetical protein